jgi:glycerol-3-phosphate dehydrogenase subunit C
MNQKNQIDKCTACTTCVAHCPVSAATRRFPGPKMLGPARERFRRIKPVEDEALEYCSNCKNCDITCPSGVPVSTINMLAKADTCRNKPGRLRDWLLSHGETLARVAGISSAMANSGMANPLGRRLLKKIGLADRLPPPYAAATFGKSFRALRQRTCPDKVVFFPGCYINYNEPQVGLDLVAVLQANGFEVIVPDKLRCCGSPLVVNGYLQEAQKNAAVNLGLLKQWSDKGVPILTACPSCGLMLKQEYQELFELEGMAEVASRVYDASEFLLALHGQGRLNTGFAPVSGRFLYHAPCHLRAQGIGRPSFDLLQLLPGITVEDADAGCCGLAGNYGFKGDKYAIAMDVGAALFQKVKDNGADAVLSDCGTCRWQIAHATGAKTAHPLSIVRRAYDRAAKQSG